MFESKQQNFHLMLFRKNTGNIFAEKQAIQWIRLMFFLKQIFSVGQWKHHPLFPIQIHNYAIICNTAYIFGLKKVLEADYVLLCTYFPTHRDGKPPTLKKHITMKIDAVHIHCCAEDVFMTQKRLSNKVGLRTMKPYWVANFPSLIFLYFN